MMILRTCRLLVLVLGAAVAGFGAEKEWHFEFGAGPATYGARAVGAGDIYNAARGCGFEPGIAVRNVPGGVGGAPAFYFTTDLAEGNWRVKVTLRGPPGGGVAAIKAELRRLMAGPVRLAENEKLERTFIVNLRSPLIAARLGGTPGRVKLKAPRETTVEAWAWDDRLTLEIDGAVLAAVDIEPAAVPVLFLLGDSTVCDQSREPYNSWGQMLPRFFQPTIAVANHGESGETYRDSIGRGRLAKIISVMKPGDWLLMQFGHNDQKQIAAGTGGPFTTYETEMKAHIAAVRQAGGIPVVVTPMERRGFDAAGKVVPSLADYARATREVATEEKVACIDLNAMSIKFYQALGPENSARAFAAPAGKVDNTHHDNYGSYELAKCVVQAIRQEIPGLAAHLAGDFTGFDPVHPDDWETFAVPPSPNFTNQRPLGD